MFRRYENGYFNFWNVLMQSLNGVRDGAQAMLGCVSWPFVAGIHYEMRTEIGWSEVSIVYWLRDFDPNSN